MLTDMTVRRVFTTVIVRRAGYFSWSHSGLGRGPRRVVCVEDNVRCKFGSVEDVSANCKIGVAPARAS